MTFQPISLQKITFLSEEYIFDANPNAPSFVFGQEGRHGVVYRLINTQNIPYALKVFHPVYRGAWLESNAIFLSQYRHLPGMKVAERRILSRKNSSDLLVSYPDFEYSVLMPWVNGKTCLEIFQNREILESSDSIKLATSLSTVLASLEKLRLAHSDISASNVIVDVKSLAVNLVGVESLYGDSVVPPPALPLGSPGYVYANLLENNQWCQVGDRLAGAILISELLTWQYEEIRAASFGESYFSPQEIGEVCTRKDLLYLKLNSISSFASDLFNQAWNSPSYDKCPPLELWSKCLLEIV